MSSHLVLVINIIIWLIRKKYRITWRVYYQFIWFKTRIFFKVLGQNGIFVSLKIHTSVLQNQYFPSNFNCIYDTSNYFRYQDERWDWCNCWNVHWTFSPLSSGRLQIMYDICPFPNISTGNITLRLLSICAAEPE